MTQGRVERAWGAWLAVAALGLLCFIMVLGTMAEDRWCGMALCENS